MDKNTSNVGASTLVITLESVLARARLGPEGQARELATKRRTADYQLHAIKSRHNYEETEAKRIKEWYEGSDEDLFKHVANDTGYSSWPALWAVQSSKEIGKRYDLVKRKLNHLLYAEPINLHRHYHPTVAQPELSKNIKLNTERLMSAVRKIRAEASRTAFLAHRKYNSLHKSH